MIGVAAYYEYLKGTRHDGSERSTESVVTIDMKERCTADRTCGRAGTTYEKQSEEAIFGA